MKRVKIYTYLPRRATSTRIRIPLEIALVVVCDGGRSVDRRYVGHLRLSGEHLIYIEICSANTGAIKGEERTKVEGLYSMSKGINCCGALL